MKRTLLLSLALTALTANAYALPAPEQRLSAESHASQATQIQPLKALAEGGSDRLIERNNRVAEGGSDRLAEMGRFG